MNKPCLNLVDAEFDGGGISAGRRVFLIVERLNKQKNPILLHQNQKFNCLTCKKNFIANRLIYDLLTTLYASSTLPSNLYKLKSLYLKKKSNNLESNFSHSLVYEVYL